MIKSNCDKQHIVDSLRKIKELAKLHDRRERTNYWHLGGWAVNEVIIDASGWGDWSEAIMPYHPYSEVSTFFSTAPLLDVLIYLNVCIKFVRTGRKPS